MCCFHDSQDIFNGVNTGRGPGDTQVSFEGYKREVGDQERYMMVETG